MVPSLSRGQMPAWFYVLRLQSGSLYTGATINLEKRFKEHLSRKACRTTALDPSLGLVYSEEFESFSEARGPEAQVKKWSRTKKEALISGDLPKLQELSKTRNGLRTGCGRGHA